jgi:putative NADH-flavin reductase
MKITVFGAAGDVGSRIVAEALSRGHGVSAVVRNHAQVDKLPTGVTPCVGDAGNAGDVARLTAGQDLAISAIRPPTGNEDQLPILTKAILDGVAQTDTRVLIVGGAASLKMPGQDDVTVMTAPGFLPDEVLPIARACVAQYDLIRADERANWSYLCPPAMLTPGARTGAYRLGRDELVVDRAGNSAISMEDFAIVLLDEAEQPKHHRIRFTAAY